jgi:nucleosome assembly protein 1-like 1
MTEQSAASETIATSVTATPETPFKDPQQASVESDMTKVIAEMPAEVQDRFKALLVIYQQMQEIDEEEEKEVRKLELQYEKKYTECYDKRAKLIKGEIQPEESYLTKFEELKTELVDEEFEKLEVPMCDVKEIQNTLKGVPGFWLRAMLDLNDIQSKVQEKDRTIL